MFWHQWISVAFFVADISPSRFVVTDRRRTEEIDDKVFRNTEWWKDFEPDWIWTNEENLSFPQYFKTTLSSIKVLLQFQSFFATDFPKIQFKKFSKSFQKVFTKRFHKGFHKKCSQKIIAVGFPKIQSKICSTSFHNKKITKNNCSGLSQDPVQACPSCSAEEASDFFRG